MPGNVSIAAPSGVFPQTLSTAFVEVREYIQLQNQFHDGTVIKSQLAATSRRTFRKAKKLTAALLVDLKTFWDAHEGGLIPFFFYNPFDATPAGSNYDPTGNSTTGRVTVVFRGSWGQSTGILRSDVPQLELVEVA